MVEGLLLKEAFYFLFRWVPGFYRTQKAYFSVILRKSHKIIPWDVMGVRADIHQFNFKEDYYYDRKTDKTILKKLEEGKNVLIKGNPLAGKSRAAYEAIKRLNPRHRVTIANPVDITTGNIIIPRDILSTRKPILLLDDINEFIGKKDFSFLLTECLKKNYMIVATCRTGPELEMVEKGLKENFAIFDHAEVEEITQEEAEDISKKTGVRPPEKFDGNIGSLFVDLVRMKIRFKSLGKDEKEIMHAVKRMYFAGIFRGKKVFSVSRIEKACGKEGLKKERFEWKSIFRELELNGFLKYENNEIYAEETYLEAVVKPDIDILQNLGEMMEVFRDDVYALFAIEGTAYHKGLVDRRKAAFMKAAIRVTLLILDTRPNPEQTARAQNNLGNAYGEFAQVENTAANCKLAIKAYEETLEIYTLADFPVDYAMTQNNLGAAYWTLADIEDKAADCERAIKAYEEALKVYTLVDSPMQYATTQNNLGAAYRTLAESEGKAKNKAENCEKAIKAYEEALKVRTFEDFLIQHAMTQNNLGTAYQTLAEVENKATNCELAINAYDEALKVRTLEKFPIQYANTQNNLGAAYQMLAHVGDKAENCKKAKAAYKEALKIFTLEESPEPYRKAVGNLKLLNDFCGE